MGAIQHAYRTSLARIPPTPPASARVPFFPHEPRVCSGAGLLDGANPGYGLDGANPGVCAGGGPTQGLGRRVALPLWHKHIATATLRTRGRPVYSTVWRGVSPSRRCSHTRPRRDGPTYGAAYAYGLTRRMHLRLTNGATYALPTVQSTVHQDFVKPQNRGAGEATEGMSPPEGLQTPIAPEGRQRGNQKSEF